jgi:hypothetical protein
MASLHRKRKQPTFTQPLVCLCEFGLNHLCKHRRSLFIKISNDTFKNNTGDEQQSHDCKPLVTHTEVYHPPLMSILPPIESQRSHNQLKKKDCVSQEQVPVQEQKPLKDGVDKVQIIKQEIELKENKVMIQSVIQHPKQKQKRGRPFKKPSSIQISSNVSFADIQDQFARHCSLNEMFPDKNMMDSHEWVLMPEWNQLMQQKFEYAKNIQGIQRKLNGSTKFKKHRMQLLVVGKKIVKIQEKDCLCWLVVYPAKEPIIPVKNRSTWMLPNDWICRWQQTDPYHLGKTKWMRCTWLPSFVLLPKHTKISSLDDLRKEYTKVNSWIYGFDRTEYVHF